MSLTRGRGARVADAAFVWGMRLLVGVVTMSPIPALAQAAEAPSTVLHLSQTAERKVVRDLLRVELRAEETGADPLALQAGVNRRMTAALDRAHQVQGVAVETGTYAVDEEQPQNAPSRWRASQSLILTAKAADALLKLAGTLQSDGLLMSSMAYELSPETVRGAEEDLTRGAGRARPARLVDRRPGASVGIALPRPARRQCRDRGQPMPRFAAMAMAAPVAQPGEATIRVTVAADLLLGPPHP